MQDPPRKKLTPVVLIFMVVVVIFVVATGFFKRVFKKEVDVKEDLTVSNYYSTLLTKDGLSSDWKPGEKFGTDNEPEISGESGLVVELNFGQIVYEKNSTKRMKIASLAKIMTFVVALEHNLPAQTGKVEDEILISQKAATIGEDFMGISEGETYSLEELLYGLVLNSGNDAAYAIAEGVAGDSGTFVKWMNMKAKELDLTDTSFADPSGLDNDSYSTAVDLVKLARYAMQKEEFRKIVGTVSIELPYSEKHKYLYLVNQTNLLTTYPGVAGIKTGYTEEAGYCLVSYAKNEGKELIGVVLNSVNRKFDMIWMLDYGYATLGVTIEHPLLIF